MFLEIIYLINFHIYYIQFIKATMIYFSTNNGYSFLSRPIKIERNWNTLVIPPSLLLLLLYNGLILSFAKPDETPSSIKEWGKSLKFWILFFNSIFNKLTFFVLFLQELGLEFRSYIWDSSCSLPFILPRHGQRS